MPGYGEDKGYYLERLRKIEGQVRGLQRMVAEDRYCIDVLTQVTAVTRALQSFSLAQLQDHLAQCVTDAVEQGEADADAQVQEVAEAISGLVRFP